MKILVTGARGMLGSDLCPRIEQEGWEVLRTDLNADGPGIHFMDVRDFDGVSACVKDFLPDMVMHLAAETDVDKCETRVQEAYISNAVATRNVARICKDRNIIMVYISTGGVFDGKKDEPYTEYDTPNPVNIYGKTKLKGEEYVGEMLKDYYIIRAGWMIGGGKEDKKFVGKIFDLAMKHNKIFAVNDKFGSPTFTKDLSNCIVGIVKTGKYGLYHGVNKGWCSRYDIACRIVGFLESKDVQVAPVDSNHFPLPAPRARSEAMVNSKLEEIGLNRMRPWEEALKEYIDILSKERVLK